MLYRYCNTFLINQIESKDTQYTHKPIQDIFITMFRQVARLSTQQFRLPLAKAYHPARFYATKQELISDKLNDIVKTFVEEKGIKLSTPLSDNMKLSEDLKLDSLDKVELIVAIEEEFELEINDEASDSFENLSQIKGFLNEKS
jgi:acyl carrier protein